MGLLHLALQSGFVNDAVVVTVNGKEVLQKPSVRTRTQIGLAEELTAEIGPGVNVVKVTLPGRQVAEETTIEGPSDAYLGVWLSADGKLNWRHSQEPFGYV